jgi:hypothetical protein
LALVTAACGGKAHNERAYGGEGTGGTASSASDTSAPQSDGHSAVGEADGSVNDAGDGTPEGGANPGMPPDAGATGCDDYHPPIEGLGTHQPELCHFGTFEPGSDSHELCDDNPVCLTKYVFCLDELGGPCPDLRECQARCELFAIDDCPEPSCAVYETCAGLQCREWMVLIY